MIPRSKVICTSILAFHLDKFKHLTTVPTMRVFNMRHMYHLATQTWIFNTPSSLLWISKESDFQHIFGIKWYLLCSEQILSIPSQTNKLLFVILTQLLEAGVIWSSYVVISLGVCHSKFNLQAKQITWQCLFQHSQLTIWQIIPAKFLWQTCQIQTILY